MISRIPMAIQRQCSLNRPTRSWTLRLQAGPPACTACTTECTIPTNPHLQHSSKARVQPAHAATTLLTVRIRVSVVGPARSPHGAQKRNRMETDRVLFNTAQDAVRSTCNTVYLRLRFTTHNFVGDEQRANDSSERRCNFTFEPNIEIRPALTTGRYALSPLRHPPRARAPQILLQTLPYDLAARSSVAEVLR